MLALVFMSDITETVSVLAQAPTPGFGGGDSNSTVVPAMFIFGDSLIDNGNNNNLFSFAKANYPPYGIDFNNNPTGRFSNGYTIVDAIAYLESPNINQMRYGVNYASAAAGILDYTGQHFVERIPFNQQIDNFEQTKNQLSGNLSADVVAQGLSKSIFFVGMGSNDYLNNYFMPGYPTSYIYDPDQFAALLIQQYTQQLTVRKMGCIPTMLARADNGQCLDSVNQAVLPFNANVKLMINKFSTTHPDAKFVFIDTDKMFQHIMNNSKKYGFSVFDRGCCGVGKNSGEVTCLPFETPCPNRKQYLFWDAFHPTSAVNVLLGNLAFNGIKAYTRKDPYIGESIGTHCCKTQEGYSSSRELEAMRAP
nr:GDSL esterase/lipase At1g71691 [Ipomoea batatas]